MKFAEAKNIFKLENNLRAGKILKPHANKGQINVNLFFDLEKLQAESLFVEIDGYLVPFFIEYSQSNFKINPSIVKFTYINSIDEAKSYTNHNVYLPLYYLKNIEDFLIDYENFIVGFDVLDEKNNLIGKITDFIDSKKNPLLVISSSGKELLLPYNAIEILHTIYEKKTIIISIPESLLEI